MKQELLRDTLLLDIYAPLLTQGQREVLHSHIEEDLSISEIARQSGKSRQAVHAKAERGMKKMLMMDQQLHIVTRTLKCQYGLEKFLNRVNGKLTLSEKNHLKKLFGEG